jgi:hypothetical protein
MTEEDGGLDRSMKFCLFWGVISMCSSVLFLSLMISFTIMRDTNMLILFSALSAGFLTLGASAFYRHSYVSILGQIGVRPNIRRFLLLYADIVLLPFSYKRLRQEVDTYRHCALAERTQ